MKNILLLLFLGNCLFAQSNVDKSLDVFPYYNNNKWGLVNVKGQVVLKPTYDSISYFGPNNQLFTAKFYNKNKIGIINKNGKVLLEGIYDNIIENNYSDISNKTKILKSNNKFGFAELVTSDSIFVSQICKLDSVIQSYVGKKNAKKYVFKNNQKWGIYANGKIIVEPLFNKVEFVYVNSNETKVKLVDDKMAFMLNNETNKLEPFKNSPSFNNRVEQVNYSNVDDMLKAEMNKRNNSSHLNLISLNNKTFSIEYNIFMKDKNVFEKGNWKTDKYNQLEKLSYVNDERATSINLLAQIKNGKFGVINERNQVIIPFVYDKISIILDKLQTDEDIYEIPNIQIKKGNFVGVISDKAEILLNPQYIYIRKLDSNLYFWINGKNQRGYFSNNKIIYTKS